jgi:hypothetical protein
MTDFHSRKEGFALSLLGFHDLSSHCSKVFGMSSREKRELNQPKFPPNEHAFTPLPK